MNKIFLLSQVLLAFFCITVLAQEKDSINAADSVRATFEKIPNQVLIDHSQITNADSLNHLESQLFFIEEAIDKCMITYSNLRDYTCIFHKTERIEDELIEDKDIIYKFMKPSSFYMRWPSGSEAIYAQGKYDNELKYHSGNIFGFIVFSLDPRGDLDMKDNRHSIFESHIGYIIDLVVKNYNQAKSKNELQSTFEGQEVISGRETFLIKSVFPKDKDYYGHIIYINLDSKLYLPEKIAVYGWDMELLEMYYFSDTQINVGLTELDFDVDNPAYDF